MRQVYCFVVTLVILLTVIFPAGMAANKQSAMDGISSGHYGKGHRYNIQGWVYIHIEGEPYERGYQYGHLASAEILDMIYRWSGYKLGSKILKIFTIKTPEQWWKICRSKAKNTFLKQIPEEYIQEMKGMVDGIKAQGGQIFGREIEFDDILASQFVQDIDYIVSNFRKGFHPVRGLLNGLKKIFSGEILNIKNGHCNAFIATGDATSDGEIVVAHASIFPMYIAQRCNIILDVQPSKGYRFMMTGPPGSLWSDEDYYQNERGIILTETELYPQGLWKTRRTTPKGVRSRRAIQYSDSIDEVIQNLKDGNNGLIPNEWLIGDTKTGEIASYMQALYNTPIKRTFDGYYWSCNLPQNVKVFGELNGVPPTLIKIFSKVFPKNDDFYIDGETVVWKDERSQKLMEVGVQYYGKINTEIAKKVMSVYPLTALISDCKITDSKLMEKLGLFTHMGKTNGLLWDPSDDAKNKFHGFTELPPTGWLEVYPLNTEPEIFQSSDISDYKEKNSRVIWQFETDDTGNINYSSSVVSEDFVYIATTSGKIYALNTVNGKQIWSVNIGNKSVKPTISKDLVLVGSDKGLHVINKDTGEIKWEKLVGEISSKPIIADDLVIASCSDGNLFTFDVDSGEKKWTYSFDDKIYLSDVQSNKIYIGSGDSCYSFDIVDREFTWTYETDGPVTASPKISGNTVYFGSWDGNIYALDSDSGNLKWNYQTGWGIDSTPEIYNGMVFVGSLDNNFYALDKENGDLAWFFTCKSAIHSNPAAYGEYVFFGCDDGRFYALNQTNGDLEWSFAPGYIIKDDDANNYLTTPILSNPVVEDGVVYFGAKGNVYALDAQTFEKPEEPADIEFELDMILLGLLAIIIVGVLILAYSQIKRKKGGRK